MCCVINQTLYANPVSRYILRQNNHYSRIISILSCCNDCFLQTSKFDSLTTTFNSLLQSWFALLILVAFAQLKWTQQRQEFGG